MAQKSKKIKDKIKALPNTPGVYQFLNSKKEIIYVGKAGNLKKRVTSYFQKGRVSNTRLELLVNEVSDIKYIKASSEAEALIYEAGLIKDYSPRFNIDLKDDKSYPFLKLTVNEKYPRLIITRKRINDGARYYGPYVNVKLLKEAVSFIKKVFPLRSCRRLHKTVCLEYHIDQCKGPCEGKITLKEYSYMVDQLKKFLEGKKDDLIRDLQKDMKKFSKNRHYEKALFAKKRIEALTAVQQLHDRSQYPIYGELDELKNTLLLPVLPMIIECFDISNIGGSLSVGSMVRFVAGKASKNDYRKYKIKTVKGIDDYSMIREIVRRRYTRLIKENQKMPDLVLIDGGKGHLSVASGVLKELGLNNVIVVSIAKEHNHLYTKTQKMPIRLSPGSRLLHLIQRIRDEAHRFAITYHRKIRRREKFDTDLRKIKGVGPKKEHILLEKFGSIKKMIKAEYKDFLDAGIDAKTAREIKKYLKLI